ncbi:MAG: hypothetical protein GX545_05425 [Fibrobacter sp.]|nr:hypothetical protein [Fibrobacter sp.]
MATLSKTILETLGFKEFNSEARIEAKFNSIYVFNIEGISLKEVNTDLFSNVSYSDDVISFAFGNTVNDISKNLIGDSFVDDEVEWQKANKSHPPYILIKISSNKLFTCESGYCKRENEKLITYDCFQNANNLLKEVEQNIIPPLISSLTIHLSKINYPIRFRFIERAKYGITQNGEIINDFSISISARLTSSINITGNMIKTVINSAVRQYSTIEPKVSSLFYFGLRDEDRFKQFLNLFQALERHTHKAFNQMNFENYVDSVNSIPKRLAVTGKQFFMERQAECKNLSQRFIWCSLILWENISDNEIETFKAIKKKRDLLSHGEQVSENDLPVEDLEKLLLKIL